MDQEFNYIYIRLRLYEVAGITMSKTTSNKKSPSTINISYRYQRIEEVQVSTETVRTETADGHR